MAEYLLTSSIDPIVKGQTFTEGEQLPRHVTIQQWFTLGHERAFHIALQNYATTVRPLKIEGTETALFGPENDTLVRRVSSLGRLALVHEQTKAMLERFGGKLRNPDWAGDGYNPHVTFVDGAALEQGEVAELSTVELIKRSSDTNIKSVELALPLSARKR